MKREFGGLDVLFRNAGIVEMRDRNPLSGKLGMSQEGKSQLAKQIPGKRFGNPREITRAVVFFASDECGFSVGSELLITGGHGQSLKIRAPGCAFVDERLTQLAAVDYQNA